MSTNYEAYYSDSDFWGKIKKFARKAGTKVIRPALELYYAFQSPATPSWAKAIAIGALGYFIFPFDLVPDLIPVAGMADDVVTMSGAITSIGRYVTPEIKQQAEEEAERWFA